MVSRLRKIVLVVLLVALLGAGGVLAWLLGSSSGARWLLNRLDARSELQLTATLDGTLWSGVDLTALDLAWTTGGISADRLHLDWRPLRLLKGELAFAGIDAGTLRFRQAAAPEAATAAAGTELPLPQLPATIRVRIEKLAIARLIVAPPAAEPLIVDDLRGSLQLHQGRLQADRLHLRLTGGTLDGGVSLDTLRPRLTADLLWRGEVFFADWSAVHLTTDLDGNGDGPLTLQVLAGDAPRLQLQARAALSATGLRLQPLQLRRSQGPQQIDGALQIDWNGPLRLGGDLQLTRFDLAPETGWRTDLSGRVQAELTADGYVGHFDLTSFRPGYEQGHIAAHVRGDGAGLDLTDIDARWFDGRVLGALRLDWQHDFQLTGALEGEGLDPAPLYPDLAGQLHLRVAGRLQVPATGKLSANWDLLLAPSTLRQRPLSGRFVGSWRQDDLQIAALDLQGPGLQLSGSGSLRQRIAWQARIDDLSGVAAGLQGALSGSGWLARPAASWLGGGELAAQDLRRNDMQAAAVTLNFDYPGDRTESRLDLTLQHLRLPAGEIDAATLSGRGRRSDHRFELRLRGADWHIDSAFAGAWQQDIWQGRVESLAGASVDYGSWELVAPAALALSRQRLTLDSFRLQQDRGGMLSAAAALEGEPLRGTATLAWQAFPLDLLNPWLGTLRLDGASAGEVALELLPQQAMRLSLAAEAAPHLEWHGHALKLDASQVTVDWDAQGLRAEAELLAHSGGRLQLTASSPQPGRRQWPQQFALDVRADAIELQSFNAWLPSGIEIDGRLQGTATGSWAPDAPPRVAGSVHIEQGELAWQGEDGTVRAPLRRAELHGTWQHGWGDGELQLQLAERGSLSGRFRLPLPADNPQAPLEGQLSLDLDEFGLLLMLLPGATNERLGRVEGELQLAGTVAHPLLTGRLAVHGAGADVPALGLQLRDAELEAIVSDSRLQIRHWKLRSGAGYLEGEGELQLSAWQLRSWNLALRGKDATVLDLPEIKVVAAPDLQLAGTPEKLSLRGEVALPSLLIAEEPRVGQVEPSADVVRRDTAATPAPQPARPLDLEVKIRLGDHVAVKARGLDARLAGELTVVSGAGGSYNGRGEIVVKQGHYAVYGIKLPISRGRAAFSGGTVKDPSLDVLAERTVGEVRAGVQVSGTLRRPVVKLVSTPPLPDTDILSYVVLGHPLGAAAGKGDNLMLAANALLSRGESAALQEKLRSRLGIDTFEVQSGGEGSLSGSMVSVGKYLTPDLYLSFGQSLFTPENVARLRYRMGKHWQAETQFGTVSGADLSYRIEFR